MGVLGESRRRAVFLDRDGVVVVPEFRGGRSYAPRRLEDFAVYPDAKESLERLRKAGYRLIVVTNQPDVGNGLMARSVLDAMHEEMCRALPLDDVRVCPHGQEDQCDCRKPSPKLLVDAAADHDIDLHKSIMVGDRGSDVTAGRAAGCTTVFIDHGYDEPRPASANFTVHNLSAAVDVILRETSARV